MPIFIFACLTVSLAFDALKTRGEVQKELMNIGREAAIAGEPVGDDIQLVRITKVRPQWEIVPFKGVSIQSDYYTRAWNGYDLSWLGEESVTVYVAVNGEVYHRRRDCSYISLSVRAVTNPESERNADGGKYLACKKCTNENAGVFYVTDYGDYYHSDRNCYGIKRNVFSMILEEARKEYRPCSRCGGGE